MSHDPYPADLRRTAHHEAAHAVALHVLGGLIGRVTLDPPRVVTLGGLTGVTCVKVAAAGPAAVAIYDGEASIDWRAPELESDWLEIAGTLRGPEAMAYAGELIDEAFALVREHWPVVEAFADRLLSAGRFDGTTAERLLNKLRGRFAAACVPA